MNYETYTLNVDHEKKVISLNFFGSPNEEDVTNFHHIYMELVTPLQTSEYLLLLNSTEMSVPESERLYQMQVSFALYRKSKFKEICFIILNDEIRKSVLKLIRFSGMEDTSDISYITPEEVDAVIKKHVQSISTT